jgi:hypothetical protein
MLASRLRVRNEAECRQGVQLLSEITSEAELYQPTRNFIAAEFPRLLSQRAGSGSVQTFGDIVSTAPGDATGRWTRPDVAALAVSRGEFVPYWRADLHTFEVKTARGLDETAVHEAHAHGRFGHYAWLAFQAAGRTERQGDLFGRVVSVAVTLGVGVLCCADPFNVHDWTLESWPHRTGADNAMADSFVRDRFGDAAKAQIRAHLAALGWSGAR